MLDGKKTAPASVTLDSVYENACKVTLTIHEGRNRQVRRMFEAVGCTVSSLIRTRIGSVDIGNLKPGEWRYLTDKEVNNLMKG